MEQGYHTPLEEYLETILSLSDEGTDVIGARIAERLGRSAPAVKEMLDRLADDGFVVRHGRTVELTQRGRDVATTVTRRHRLAERLLADVIGLAWHKVHEEAGRWEHVISPDVEERLIALLGDPATCPHGNPIPGSHHLELREERPLASAKEGEDIELIRISEMLEHDEGSMIALDEAAFIPGRQGTFSHVGSEGTMTISTSSGMVVLPSDLTEWLYVTMPSAVEVSSEF